MPVFHTEWTKDVTMTMGLPVCIVKVRGGGLSGF